MMHRGYIKLWRKSFGSVVWADINLWRTWCCCLMLANHKDKWVSVDGLAKPVKVGPGEFITGRYAFHKEMYPKRKKSNPKPITVWRWLKCLELCGNLNIQSNMRYSLISIINWNTYQGEQLQDDQANDQPMINQRSTGDQPVITNKNVKNKTSTKSRSAGIFEFIDPKLLKRIGTKWPKCYQWIQKSLKHNKNENAIIHVLKRIDGMKSIHDYYAFATKVLNVESGNYNEQEFKVQEAQKQKQRLKEHLESIGEKI